MGEHLTGRQAMSPGEVLRLGSAGYRHLTPEEIDHAARLLCGSNASTPAALRDLARSVAERSRP